MLALAQRARLLAVALWAGSLWTVGYLVAPTLFGTLDDRALAGMIAGRMFRSEAWLSMVLGTAMLGLLAVSKDLTAQRRKTLYVVVIAMLACMLVSHLGLQPAMARLRQAGERGAFGMLHGVSMVLYMIQSLLALVLVLKNR